MRRVFAIARREVQSYFDLPIAYVVLPAFWVLGALYLFVLHPYFVVGRTTLRPFFEFAPFIFTLFVPALSMRLIAEEHRSGNIEVLLTWPLGDGELVAGKFLGAFLLLALAVVATAPFPLMVAALGPLDWGPVFGGYLGLLLLGGAYLGIGLLASALTRNQIVAFIGGFLACFSLYVVGKALPVLPAAVTPWVEAISFDLRFAGIARGVVELGDVAFFVGVIGVSIGLAAEVLGARRWR
ncbi:MAG: ABC transporter permease [bacterium]|nr:ABC transporter permease subunit [Myxococcales bacterium]